MNLIHEKEELVVVLEGLHPSLLGTNYIMIRTTITNIRDFQYKVTERESIIHVSLVRIFDCIFARREASLLC